MKNNLDIIIERWSNLDKSTDYRWSVWQGGSRVNMGGPHPSAEESEREAVTFCRKSLKREPDRIEHL